jgi:hypothetical protein
MKILFSVLFTLFSVSSFAQMTTSYVHLSSDSYVPLYDCSIFQSHFVREDCHQLNRRSDYHWERGGYAVSCRDFRHPQSHTCQRMARELLHSRYSIDCRHLPHRSIHRDRCEITMRAYERGFFEDTFRPTHTTTTTTRVIETTPVRSSCQADSYDRSYQAWLERKEEQRRRGRNRTAVGVATTVGGLILGGSSNSTTRTLGQALQIGGVFMTTWGLVELADANNPPPHMMSGCSQYWRGESRRVVIEEQHCTSTRYTEVGRHTTRSYYEINCSNRRYVTYERFDPWYRGY